MKLSGEKWKSQTIPGRHDAKGGNDIVEAIHVLKEEVSREFDVI